VEFPVVFLQVAVATLSRGEEATTMGEAVAIMLVVLVLPNDGKETMRMAEAMDMLVVSSSSGPLMPHRQPFRMNAGRNPHQLASGLPMTAGRSHSEVEGPAGLRRTAATATLAGRREAAVPVEKTGLSPCLETSDWRLRCLERAILASISTSMRTFLWKPLAMMSLPTLTVSKMSS
jgi:hypothetical protein